MEMQFTFISTTLLILASFTLIILINKLDKTKQAPKEHQQKWPPSPQKLPVIGHLHLLLFWVIYHHNLKGIFPHKLLTKLAKRYGPVMHLQLGRISSVIISSRQAAKQVLKVEDLSCADKPELICGRIMFYDCTDIAFSPYNDYWKQMRKLCISELLSAKNVRSFSSIRQDETSRLMKSIIQSSPPGEAINLTEKVFAFTCSFTCRTAFGEETKGREKLMALLKKAVNLFGGLQMGDMFPYLDFLSLTTYKMLRMRRNLDPVLDAILEKHKSKQRGEFGGEDIIDVLLKVQQAGEVQVPITNENIKAIISIIFGAGSETSSTALDWAMVELIRNPCVMAKARDEVRQALKGKKIVEESDVQMLKYLKMVIKETLRMHPPIPLLPRACRQECQVDGYTIPLKAMVVVNIWAIGRDPEYWIDPESFQPERFENNCIDFLGNNFEFIPFGAGRRICPGINFGLANVELPLAQLLYHFDWKMPKGMSSNDIDMTEADGGLVVARKDDLFLVPTVCINPF